jgi:predicted alpha/beta-hydrolase family hydrolase
MDSLKIVIPGSDEHVSGLLLCPAEAKALYLFAHGAGAGMTHKSMAANAEGLAARGIATLRYQFLYMEKARNGLTRRNSLMRSCGRRRRKPRSWHRTCPSSRGAVPSADA